MQKRSLFSCPALLFPRLLKNNNTLNTAVSSDSSTKNRLSEVQVRAKKLLNLSHTAAEKGTSGSAKHDELLSLVRTKFGLLEEEEKPVLPLTDKWTPLQHERVNFNLKKLKSLSGLEKIELFRDYVKTKSVAKAIYVYSVILFNGIGNKLEFKDHHKLFCLLLVDPVMYKQEILKIKHEMAENSFIFTDYMMNEYIFCCLKWNDADAALKTLQTCHSENVSVSIITWQHLIRYFHKKNDAESSQTGISIYDMMCETKPLVRPSSSVYELVMKLYCKLGMHDKVKEIYTDAEENLERLVLEKLKKPEMDEQMASAWKANTHTNFFTNYLISLIDNPELLEKEYKEFAATGVLKMAKKESPNLFRFLLGKVLKTAADVNKKRILFEEFKRDMIEFQVKPDYAHFSYMIKYAGNLEEIKQIYRDATTNGAANMSPAHYPVLDTAYISALILLDPLVALEALKMMHQRLRKPFDYVYEILHEALLEAGDYENAARVRG